MRAAKGEDGKGSRWREEDAQRVVEAWRQSGLSARAYGQSAGVHPRRLLRWAARLREAKREDVQFHAVRLVQQKASESPVEAWLEVVVEGCRIRVPHGFRSEDLVQVLDVLEARAVC